MTLQWRNKFWQSLEEGAGKRGSECVQLYHSPNNVCLSNTSSCSYTTLRTMYVSPTPVAAAILLSEQCMSHLHRSCIHATLRTMYVSPIPVAAAMLFSEQCMSLQQLLLEPCYSPNNMCLTYTCCCSHATLRTMYVSPTAVAEAMLLSEQ